VCERERERERESKGDGHNEIVCFKPIQISYEPKSKPTGGMLENLIKKKTKYFKTPN
jgi:hypothetical protein